MLSKKYLPIFFLSLFCLSAFKTSLKAQEVAAGPAPSGTQMVTVGDPYNQPDEQGNGQVNVPYQIGAYEWTVQDWCTMLNSVASDPEATSKIADPHGLWNPAMTPWITRAGDALTGYAYKVTDGKGNLPITNINRYDCARACNYMQNKSQLPLAAGVSIDSITEHGSYEITVDANGITHVILQAGGNYAIPTRAQWSKAAYYRGGSSNAGYWLYPTRSDTNPGDAAGDRSGLHNNNANYNLYPLDPWAPALALTPVDHCGKLGANNLPMGTYSPYGCFDMAGNVNEWTTTTDSTGNFIVQGGAYDAEYYMMADNYLMRTCTPQAFAPDTRSNTLGFRMVARNLSNDGSLIVNTSNNTPISSLTTGEEEAIAIPAVGAVLIGGVWYLGGEAVGTAAASAGEWVSSCFGTGAAESSSVATREGVNSATSRVTAVDGASPKIPTPPEASTPPKTLPSARETSDTPNSTPRSGSSSSTSDSDSGRKTADSGFSSPHSDPSTPVQPPTNSLDSSSENLKSPTSSQLSFTTPRTPGIAENASIDSANVSPMGRDQIPKGKVNDIVTQFSSKLTSVNSTDSTIVGSNPLSRNIVKSASSTSSSAARDEAAVVNTSENLTSSPVRDGENPMRHSLQPHPSSSSLSSGDQIPDNITPVKTTPVQSRTSNASSQGEHANSSPTMNLENFY